MDAERLRVAYHNFQEATPDTRDCEWPQSIDSQHFLAFSKDWKPLLSCALTKPKYALGFSGLDAVRIRRKLLRTLLPVWQHRHPADAQTKLYSDHTIGLAGFTLFGFGIAAGIMIAINLWTMGRKWSAAIGSLIPLIGFASVYFPRMLLKLVETNHKPCVAAVWAISAIIILGYPFVVCRFWRWWSGRDVRLHMAFGGPRRSWWQILLPFVIGLGIFWRSLELW